MLSGGIAVALVSAITRAMRLRNTGRMAPITFRPLG